MCASPVQPRSIDCLMQELPLLKKKALLEKKKHIDHDNMLATSASTRSKCMSSNSVHVPDFVFFYIRITVQDHIQYAGLAPSSLFPCAAFPVSRRSIACLMEDLQLVTKQAMLEKKKHIDHDNMLETSASTRSKCMSSNSVHIPDFVFLCTLGGQYRTRMRLEPAGLAVTWLFPCAAFPVSPRPIIDCLMQELPLLKKKAICWRKRNMQTMTTCLHQCSDQIYIYVK